MLFEVIFLKVKYYLVSKYHKQWLNLYNEKLHCFKHLLNVTKNESWYFTISFELTPSAIFDMITYSTLNFIFIVKKGLHQDLSLYIQLMNPNCNKFSVKSFLKQHNRSSIVVLHKQIPWMLNSLVFIYLLIFNC